MGSFSQELTDAEMTAFLCCLFADQSCLLWMVIHRCNDGFSGEAAHAKGGRVTMLAIGLNKFIAMARMCAAVEGGDTSVFKLKVVKNPSQPRVFDSAHTILLVVCPYRLAQ